MTSQDDRLANLALALADLMWAHQGILTVMSENWTQPWTDKVADLFESLSFEYHIQDQKGKLEVSTTYWSMYLGLRVDRNQALLRAVVELW